MPSVCMTSQQVRTGIDYRKAVNDSVFVVCCVHFSLRLYDLSAGFLISTASMVFLRAFFFSRFKSEFSIVVTACRLSYRVS
jgi:hypothetical protein